MVNAFLCAFIGVVLFTPAVRKIAINMGVVDDPADDPRRKIHHHAIPLLGGLALMMSFWIVVAALIFLFGFADHSYLLPKHFAGLFAGTVILAIGGYYDDRYRLSPLQQIAFPLAAAIVVIVSGMGITYISNPFGETFYFDTWQWHVVTIFGVPYHFTLIADFVTVGWMLVMMYTTKLLDGLDGLVTGIGGIASIIIFFLSQSVGQPETATLALVLAGACLGFLLYNWHPARIFLGEGGSLWMGFMLGALSIISGSKITTTLLVVGVPFLDVLWVIARRLIEHRSPFHGGDKKHLHHRLLDIGLSHRQAVIFLYALSTIFGVSALMSGGREKVVLLVLLAMVMVILGGFLVFRYRQQWP